MTRLLLMLAAMAASAHAAEPAAPIKLVLSSAELRAALNKAQLTPSAIEQPIEPRTAVDWRLSDGGAKAQAGYLCGLGGIGPDSEPIPGGPASVYGHAGTFLGAALAFPIP